MHSTVLEIGHSSRIVSEAVIQLSNRISRTTSDDVEYLFPSSSSHFIMLNGELSCPFRFHDHREIVSN